MNNQTCRHCPDTVLAGPTSCLRDTDLLDQLAVLDCRWDNWSVQRLRCACSAPGLLTRSPIQALAASSPTTVPPTSTSCRGTTVALALQAVCLSTCRAMQDSDAQERCLRACRPDSALI